MSAVGFADKVGDVGNDFICISPYEEGLMA